MEGRRKMPIEKRMMNPMLAALSGMYPVRYARIRQSRKCLFEGCTNMTDHNGGYCCAEHCKQDRINKKQSLKTVIKNQSAFAQ